MHHVMTEDVEVHFFLSRCLKTFHPRLLLELCQLFFRAEAHRIHIDVDGTLHASATHIEHAPPVLEGIVHQSIRRNGGDGLVPITHLHGGERHFDDIPVGTVLRHRNPVARTKHIVGGELHPCHQALDGILEDQHQDGRTGTQTGQDGYRVLVYQRTDDDNRANADDNQLNHLIETFHRMVLQLLVLARYGVERSEESAYQLHPYHRDVYPTNLQDKFQQSRFVGESERYQGIHHHRRNQMAYVVQHVIVQQIVIPSDLRLGRHLAYPRHHYLATNHIQHVCYQENRCNYHDTLYREQASFGYTHLLQPRHQSAIDCFHIRSLF